MKALALTLCALATATMPAQQTPSSNPFTTLMLKATAHANAHHTTGRPVLSPLYTTVLNGEVNVDELHSHGIRLVVWTPNDADTQRTLITKYHVDGIITDEPEKLMGVLAKLREEYKGDPKMLHELDAFESSAHRGGRADRPENTIPSFENGIDSGISVLETDTYVTSDGISAIWHDAAYNPNVCRRVDGAPYDTEHLVYIRDFTMAELVKTIVCDKPYYGTKGTVKGGPPVDDFSGHQTADLSLSPVSVAFAKKEGMPSPYSPTNASQLFRFMKYYQWYYESGPGKKSPLAKQRTMYAKRIRVAPETKIEPPEHIVHAQATPQQFVNALGGAIKSESMEGRAEIQSFYYPTLLLFQEQYPMLSTYYLTATPKILHLKSMPEALKVE
jgi:glycerophosphoryl diester phosphodiesterase